MRRILALLGAAALVLTGGAAASATEVEHPYIIAVWEVTSGDEANAFATPQTLVDSFATDDVSSKETVREQAIAAVKLECGKVYQIDPYNDDDVTAALLAGGVLYGPGNPSESLANGNWVYVSTDACPAPEKPAPVVTEKVDCEAERVTITTTDYILNEETNTWKLGEAVTTTRPVTDTEAAKCAGPEPDALVHTGEWQVVSENCVDRTEQRIVTTTGYERVGTEWVTSTSSQEMDQRVVPSGLECPAVEPPASPSPTPSSTPTSSLPNRPISSTREGSAGDELAVTGPLDYAIAVTGAGALLAIGIIAIGFSRRRRIR